MKIILYVFIYTCSIYAVPYQAVCIVPYTDLIGSQAGKHAYHSIPAASKKITNCIRNHQLIFNETVTVIEEKGDEVCVEIHPLFFTTHTNKTPQHMYWCLKSAVMKITPDIHRAIPSPIHKQTDDTVALLFPFHDPITKCIYSAGTRFVPAEQQHEDTYTVFVCTPNEKIERIQLPRNICIHAGHKTKQERIADFVTIVRLWAKQNIPYVWGGCSFTRSVTQYHTQDQQNAITYTFAHNDTTLPGLDCAGLITRAAHLAHIPFAYKNSLTMATHLQPLDTQEHIENGDIIWIPGHVMVVSSIQHNLITEARGYGHGYGCVQEIPISKQFQGIYTYAQLRDHLLKKKSLKRLDKTGSIVAVIPEFKILKMASA